MAVASPLAETGQVEKTSVPFSRSRRVLDVYADFARLTTPFFRGDTARTAALGAGLGLAIVEKAVQRMGGDFELANASDGGLVAHVRLRKAP